MDNSNAVKPLWKSTLKHQKKSRQQNLCLKSKIPRLEGNQCLQGISDQTNIFGKWWKIGFHDIWSKTTWSNVSFCWMLLFVEPDVWLNFRLKNCQIDILSKICWIFIGKAEKSINKNSLPKSSLLHVVFVTCWRHWWNKGPTFLICPLGLN